MSVPPPDPGLPGLEELVAPKAAKPAKLKPVRVGNVTLPIYHYGDGRWTTIYRLTKGGKRITESRKTEAAIRERAVEICLDIAKGKVNADRLTGDERLQAVAARDLLAEAGMSLDAVAREVTDARALTGGAGIMEMARFWERHHRGIASRKSIEDIHAELLASKRDHGLSQRYWRGLDRDLAKFCAAFQGRAAGEILADEVLKYLRDLNVGWRRRNNVHSQIITLFRYAKDMKRLPQDRDTEPELVERLPKPRNAPPPRVFTPDELKIVLANVKPEWLPWIALGAFAGLRTAEIERLEWSDVLYDDKLIHIRDEVAKRTSRKVGDARYVPMSANLLAWLKSWRGSTGPVCTSRRSDRETGRLGRFLPGGKWGQNPLRHSWISYRSAETSNLPLVADEAGNSTEISRTAYRNPRMKREAVAWFSIFPETEKPANVVEMTL